MNSTSNFTSRFSFQNTHLNKIENRSLIQGLSILSYSHHRKTQSYSERTFDSTPRHYKRPKLHCPLFFFRRSCDNISFLNDGPIFFSWRYWFGYHARMEQSIAIPSVHHLEICFRRGQSSTLNTTNERPLIPNKTYISSLVVDASVGHHSQFAPALAVLHSLNDLILFPSRCTYGKILENLRFFESTRQVLVLCSTLCIRVASDIYRIIPSEWYIDRVQREKPLCPTEVI